MLDSFRTNMRGIALGIVIFIGAIFAFSGTGSLLTVANVDTAIVVNDVNISENDVVRAILSQKRRILGENEGLDPAVLDDEMLRPGVIEQLITRQLFAQDSMEQNLTFSQQDITNIILDIEGFQSEGKFDQNLYRFAIQQQGYTSANFNDVLKNDMVVQQLVTGLSSTAFTTNTELSALAGVTEQQRNYYYLRLPVQGIEDLIELSDTQVDDYYQNNRAVFTTDAQVRIDYIELNSDLLMDVSAISEDQVLARFEEEAENRDLAESRQVAHILLSEPTPEGIEEIQTKLNAGVDFAVLAKDYSEDFGSADSGGDLGYTSGDTFPEAFEVALAGLEIGQVSEPVNTDAGTHFIKLLDIQQQTYELSEQRSRIERELIKESTSNLLVEKLQNLKELSFNAESLTEVARAVGLEKKTSEPFSKAGGSGISAFPAVVKAAFSSEVVNDQYASEVLELGDDRYLVLKLNEYIDARQQELAEVRDRVVQLVTDQESKNQLAEQGGALLARVIAGESIETVAKSENLNWQVVIDGTRRANSANTEIGQKVFSLPRPLTESIVEGFYLSNGDFVVASLTEVTEGRLERLTSQQRAALVSASTVSKGSRDLDAYQRSLLAKATIIK
ncbi:MAG: SurA N-terminal domain-containing protein [Proteobacteria bacterium]|nr:SurA N-terminal domain-containing protein [Pseudomonadota bacterium]MDA1351001.1 SurA N-terminal domain-containing protein [Pseudomonadota bacterium]